MLALAKLTSSLPTIQAGLVGIAAHISWKLYFVLYDLESAARQARVLDPGQEPLVGQEGQEWAARLRTEDLMSPLMLDSQAHAQSPSRKL